METFLIKLAVAVIPLISIVAIVIICDAHTRKRMILKKAVDRHHPVTGIIFCDISGGEVDNNFLNAL